MIISKALQLLFLVSSITSQALIKGMVAEKKEIGEGIAQKIEELPKELRYNIFSSALALRENPKYEVYRKFDVGSSANGIALTADNTRALTGSIDGIARIWDIEKGELLQELKGHEQMIKSAALSADGNIALTGSYDKTARVWNMKTGELLKTIPVGSYVFSVALSADGTLALTGSYDGIARLYNTSTGELLKELKGHKDVISSVALSADGTIAFTGSEDQTACVWDTLAGQLLRAIEIDSLGESVALSADGTIALTWTFDDKVLVWDTNTGALLNTLLTKADVKSIALSKDGKRALVGTEEGSIQVWDTKPLPGQTETSIPLTVLAGHTKAVTAVAFGSDDFIASAAFDKTALIWKPYALKLQSPLEHEEVLRQAYKETFSRPLLRSKNGN